MAKKIAAIIRSMSEKLITSSELSDVRKYSPIKQIATANHIDTWRFFLSIILKIKGTIGTYKAVIKAAFETSVKSKAYCWIVAPKPSANPVVIIKIADLGSVIVLRKIFFSKYSKSGNIVKAPSKKRAKVKVSGPTKPIPVVWATNVVPQITEANRSSRLPLKIFN